jgi:hypothetical protein
MPEEIKVGGPKMDPKMDILYQAACERQRKYWAEKLPTLTDEQVGIIMDALTQATNLITTLDMADGLRSQVPFRSKLGTAMRMVTEMLSAPQERAS